MFRKMKEWFSSYGHTDRQLNDVSSYKTVRNTIQKPKMVVAVL